MADREPIQPTINTVVRSPTSGPLNLLLDEQGRCWQRGERVLAEVYLRRYTDLADDPQAMLELVHHEWLLREKEGDHPQLEEYLQRFPQHSQQIRDQFAVRAALTARASAPPTPAPVAADDKIPMTQVLEHPTWAGPLLPPLNPEASEEPRGKVPIIPGYVILGELGRGGMGVVYKARQQKADRIVALKMILSGAHASRGELARFQTEAQAIARLQHPNIVQVHEVGEWEGLPYFSLEYCAGGSLEKKLSGVPLHAGDAARLVETLARAIQSAHDSQVIHRDLKPANILLTEDGTPKISDFGLAKRLDATAHTATGATLGTPSYMAPEQAGSHSKEVGPQADVYALGAILYELLSGRPPFKAASLGETLYQVLHVDAVPPRQLQRNTPPDLEIICLKCLEKDPARRYATAAALADDLRAFQEDRPIKARPPSALERARKWVRRRPTAATLLLVSVLMVVGLAWFTMHLLKQQALLLDANRERVLAQVEQLRTADTQVVPAILKSLEAVQDDTLPRLRELWEREDDNREMRMRVGLALLPADPDAVRGPLRDWMLEADDPLEVEVVRNALVPWGEELKGDLWRRVDAVETPSAVRFRALVALARFDPDDPRWRRVGATVIEPWLKSDPVYLGVWTRALRPVCKHVNGPLSEVFRGQRAKRIGKRTEAASILAHYFEDDPARLADLLADADADQFGVLFPILRKHGEQAITLLHQELEGLPGPSAPEPGRQANAAVALLLLDRPDRVWPLFRHRPDPSVRSYLLHRAAPLGLAAGLLVERLEKEEDVSARRALILALGEFSAEQLPPVLRQRVGPRLLRWYREDPDAGIHGAVDWLLRHGKDGPEARPLDWGQTQILEKIDRELQGRQPPDQQRWYVSGQGQTLTIIPGPVEFRMGSPAAEPDRDDDEVSHQRRLRRSFAVASKSVTVAEFQRFLKANPFVRHSYIRSYSPEADCPIANVTWYEAAQYCRWLSEQEGVPEEEMGYPPVAEIEKCKASPMPLKLPADYLKRQGYRLPTGAEWEYACRAGADTSHYYGSGLDLLPCYAWYLKNASGRTWPVGQKKPNDLGLFDMHGNVWNWGQEAYALFQPRSDGKPVEDEEDLKEITDQVDRVLRGGSFIRPPAFIRCASRNYERPSVRYYGNGLRLVRTWR